MPGNETPEVLLITSSFESTAKEAGNGSQGAEGVKSRLKIAKV